MNKPFADFKNAVYPNGDISQGFGENQVLYKNACDMDGHNGYDFVAPWGTPILCVEGGLVVDVKDDPAGYGKHVRVCTQNESGENREWSYGHFANIIVSVGQEVKEGDILGSMGNTGFVVSSSNGLGYWKEGSNKYAGTHLHLGCRKFIWDKKGWCYHSGQKKMTILNYLNGFFGSFDYGEMLPDTSTKLVYQFKNTISQGDRSVDVGKLQDVLIRENIGYNGGITNYFGELTRAGVLAFQLKHNIKLSWWERNIMKGNKVGEKTLKVLNEIYG